jgi:hypothetical protein
VKLEVIRQASIPYEDPLQKKSYLPLHCVERVWDVELLSDTVVDRRLPMRMDFDIKGLGRWKCDLSILVDFSDLPKRDPLHHFVR